jgi:hypothetical protein
MRCLRDTSHERDTHDADKRGLDGNGRCGRRTAWSKKHEVPLEQLSQ